MLINFNGRDWINFDPLDDCYSIHELCMYTEHIFMILLGYTQCMYPKIDNILLKSLYRF